jgi:Type II secretion system (T2SS), protein E, N-terminal domain
MPSPPPRKKLGEILIDAGVLTADQLKTALVEQKRWGGPIGRVLVDMRMVPEEVMVQAVSRQLKLPAVNLDAFQVDPTVRDLVPGEFAEQHSVIPLEVQGKFLDVAMSDPTNLGVIDELRIRTRLNIRSYLCGPKAMDRALARFYNRGVATLDQGEQLRQASTTGLTPPFGEAQAAARQPRQTSGLTPPFGEPVTPSPAAARRAQQFEFAHSGDTGVGSRDLVALTERIRKLEALVARDEDVIRKLLALLIEKGVASREEILAKIR